MSSISSGDKNKRSQAHSLGSISKRRQQGRKGPITLCTRPLSEKRTRTLRKRRPNTKVHHQQDPIWAYNAMLCNVLKICSQIRSEGAWWSYSCYWLKVAPNLIVLSLKRKQCGRTASYIVVLMIMWVQYIRYLTILCGILPPSNIFTLG